MARRPRDPVKFPFGDSGDGPDDGDPAGGAASGSGAGAGSGSGSGSGEESFGSSDEADLADALTSESGAEVDDPDRGERPRRRPGEGTREVPRRPVDDRVKFPFGTSADERDPLSVSSRSLPNLPPGARPEDDASLESIEDSADPAPLEDVSADVSGEGLFDSSDEDVVDLSDLGNVSARVSDLGPISPSGPLVILDDEDPGASTRYQASVVDDSARLAGSKGDLRAFRGEGKRRKRPPSDPDDEDVDADVPVPDRSARAGRASGAGRSGRRSGAGRVGGAGEAVTGAGAVVAPASKAAMIVRLLLAFTAVGLALLAGEVRLQKALEAERARHALEVAGLKEAHAGTLARERQLAADALAGEKARGEQDARLALERAAREAAAERERAVEAARQEATEAARAAAEREAREAVEVELARAREAGGAAVDDAVRRAREEERAAAERALAEQAARDDARRVKELEDLRAELQDELSAMETRAAEEYMARVLAEERAAALDRAQPAGGGSAAEGLGSGGGTDDWDQYFTGASSGGEGSGSGSGSGAGGGAGEDPFAVADGGSGGHVVDRAWAWLQANIHGSVGYRNLSHFYRGPDKDLRKTRHELRIKLDYRDWLWRSDDALAGLRLVSILDVRVDDADYAVALPHGVDDEERRRPIVWPEELHLDLAYDWLTVKGGYQIFAWGTGDLLNPTDVLNPIDFSDLFDTRRISVLSASVEATFEHVSLELASIPSFTRSRLPLQEERFDVLSGASPVPVLRPDDPEASVQNAQWGARLKGNALGWDVSISGYTGFDDLPSPRLLVRSLAPLDVVIDPTFDRFHMAGADFATTLGFLGLGGKLGDVLGGIQLHGEAAHFFVEGDRQDDFLQYVVGLNYTWIDLIAEHDLTLVLEYAGDLATSEAEGALPGVRLNRILRGAVLARLEYAVDEDLAFELNAAVITFGEENGLIHPGVRWNVTDNLRLELGGDVFFGPEDTFFGQFRRDGRAIFDVKWVF